MQNDNFIHRTQRVRSAQLLTHFPERIGWVWLADEHTAPIAEQLKAQCPVPAHLITVRAGDDHKNLETLSTVWQELQQVGATRTRC